MCLHASAVDGRWRLESSSKSTRSHSRSELVSMRNESGRVRKCADPSVPLVEWS